MSKSWPTTSARRLRARRRHTFPFDTGSAPTDCTTRSSPCPNVSSRLTSEASMPSTSEGRVPSTNRKRSSAEMEDSAPPEPRRASSPKKRKFKTARRTSDDDDLVPATPTRMHHLQKSSENSGPVSEKTVTFQEGRSDDSPRGIRGTPINTFYRPPHTSENITSTENVQQNPGSFTQLEFDKDPRSYEVRSAVVEEFFAKYQLLELIGAGGFGKVCAGERLGDKRPVAVKVIRKQKVVYLTEYLNGVPVSKTILEVFLLSRVGAGLDSVGSTVTPLLLDWYDVGAEVLLVFERPEPCMDLMDYVSLHHQEGVNGEIAKVIFRQLVEAAIEMQERGVFHRDIKLENILIENIDDIPRARFIDFGSATTFLPGDIFSGPQGTLDYSSPEWFRDSLYRAGSTTVWQLGLALFMMLFNRMPLRQEETIGSFRHVPIPTDCSENLRSLLRGCLAKDPEERFTLEELINHPWLNE